MNNQERGEPNSFVKFIKILCKLAGIAILFFLLYISVIKGVYYCLRVIFPSKTSYAVHYYKFHFILIKIIIIMIWHSLYELCRMLAWAGCIS